MKKEDKGSKKTTGLEHKNYKQQRIEQEPSENAAKALRYLMGHSDPQSVKRQKQ